MSWRGLGSAFLFALDQGGKAAPVAAALAGKAGGGTVVCVVSGGNMDVDALARILAGQMP